MYQIQATSTFKKELKKAAKRKLDLKLIEKVIGLLAKDDTPLAAEYRDHSLKGHFEGFRECHIQPDWLLVYKKNAGTLILHLSRTGTHSDLFK